CATGGAMTDRPWGGPLFFRPDQRTCRSGSCVQIERSACHEEVQPQPEHTNRLSVGNRIYGGVADIRPVNDRDPAATFHLQRIVRSDKGSRVLIQADAYGEGVVVQRGTQASQAFALAEVLVNDEAIREPEPRGQLYAPCNRRGAFVARGDHVLTQNAGTRARAANGDAVSIASSNQLRDGRAAQECSDSQLIAAGEEDAGRLLEAAQPAGLLAVTPGVEIHVRDTGDTDIAEQFLIPR